MSYGFIVFLLVVVFFYRARGPKQRALANRGLRWGIVLGCIGFGIGLVVGIVIAASVHPTESSGFAALLGPFYTGPIGFKIGLPIGFVAGVIRQWFWQAANPY
ncbi:MAG TPA: hypothetical protein VN513_16265 [Gemmatimonadales bacterium]|nr:hypothetical protein [Gemmatimonadales bacterium]